MKRCPNCDRTYDDSLRFCQVDGTSLVDDAPLDPYKTMMGRPEDFAAASGGGIAQPDEVLEIPSESDPRKTMFASEDEVRRAMRNDDSPEPQVIEIPPIAETPAPEPPRFNEPSLSPPSFAEPSSPFSTPEPSVTPRAGDESSRFEPPPMFSEPDRSFESFGSQQASAPMAQSEYQAPGASGWQPAGGGGGSFTPPGPPASQNQTLAIVSLVLGILSIVCCTWFLPGIAAIAVGYIAKNKADKNPAEFGGRGLALGGMITGGISVLLGVVMIALYFLGALAGVMTGG